MTHRHIDPDHPRAVMDPVCRHWILPEDAAATAIHEGATVHFCRVACHSAFQKAPDRFLPQQEGRLRR